MTTPRSVLTKEVEMRVENTRQAMERRGYDALIVYGTNKVCGSLRYLTDYFPDRAGWTSLGPDKTYLFEGGAFVLPLRGEPALVLEPGLFPGKRVCVKNIVAPGLVPKKGDSFAKYVAEQLAGAGAPKKVGIESWHRFPAPSYLELRELVPQIEFLHSTIVEEMRMVKSPLEVDLISQGALVGDVGHQTVTECLRSGIGKTELEIIRACEQAMRDLDPIYEDSCTGSPSLISSGSPIEGALLVLPQNTKRIARGDVVHWDIDLRYEGYPIDTSRTRVIGKATDAQKSAYEVSLEMHEAVLRAAKPGTKAHDLASVADQVARKHGFQLWEKFLGHGVGLDTHERPDMGIEETRLAANMVLAIEPRIATDAMWVFGNEDMVLVTDTGGVPLTHFPKTPLELEA